MSKKKAPGSDQSNMIATTQNISSGVGEYVKGTVSLTLRYFAALIVSSLLIGIASTLIFKLLGIPVPLLWGIIAGVGNAIPVVGQWASVVIIAVLLLIISPKYALYSLITLLVLQTIDGFVVQPLVVGQAVSLKPLLVVVITLVASSFFGWIGLLFAVPIAASLKLAVEIILRHRKKAQQNNPGGK